MIVDN